MGALSFGKSLPGWAAGVALASVCVLGHAQTLPATTGETLTGQPLALAQAVKRHPAVLIASFSKDAGSGADAWARAVRQDTALAGVATYEAAMLERAPGFIRGIIKSGLRKQVPAGVQDHFLVLTQDEPLWRSYFGVSTDKDPYVVLLDASGRTLWHGHGDAQNLEPLLKAALR
jgi:hypothetical protein